MSRSAKMQFWNASATLLRGDKAEPVKKGRFVAKFCGAAEAAQANGVDVKPVSARTLEQKAQRNSKEKWLVIYEHY